MKKLRSYLILGALAGMFFTPLASEAGVRVYLRFGPPKLKTVKVVKPVKPFRHAYWVSGHWAHKNGRYVYVSGYWTKHRHGYVYVNARWLKSPRGYYFVPGHWVKK
ncbi:MAG: hypothetical protein ACE5IR_17650 [bacterium]